MFKMMSFQEDPLIKMWDGKQLDKDKAVALAKYRAIDVRMYPPIFLRVPTDDMIFHIQVSNQWCWGNCETHTHMHM